MDSFVLEECRICHRCLDNTDDIFVDIDTDNYICLDCAEEYNIKVVPIIPEGGI